MVLLTTAAAPHAAAAVRGLCRVRLTYLANAALACADSAYGGELVIRANGHLNLTIRTIGRPETSGCGLTGRGAAGRYTAWMMDARRRARDYERLIQHSETLITRASITLMTRRPAGPSGKSAVVRMRPDTDRSPPPCRRPASAAAVPQPRGPGFRRSGHAGPRRSYGRVDL